MSMSAESYELVIPSHHTQPLKTGVVHLGFGAFHRAHQAYYFDRLAETPHGGDWGIACVNLRKEDASAFAAATKALPYVLRSIASDGAVQDRKVGVHTGAYDWSVDAQQAEALLASPDVAMVTITVSEAAYYFDGQGNLDAQHPAIHAELADGAKTTVYAYLRAALTARMAAGGGKLTIACCDNIRSNGDMLARNFGQYLELMGDDEVAGWIAQNASFPNSMVDRITPKPPVIDVQELEAEIGCDLGPVIVAEDFVQWVIEDNFAGARPPLELVGVTVTDDVEPYEETKIRVLNGGHTALTYMGALAGYETFDQAFVADDLNDHFGEFERQEVLSSLPKDLPFDASEYLDTISRRFRNQHIGDTVQRICGDGFAKFPIFIRPTLEGCFERGQTPTRAIRSIASWVLFSRRVFNERMDFDYHEPNRDRLAPLISSNSLDDFVESEPLWGDLAHRFPAFKTELEKQLELVEQKWPA